MRAAAEGASDLQRRERGLRCRSEALEGTMPMPVAAARAQISDFSPAASANNGPEHKRDNQHDGHDHGDDAVKLTLREQLIDQLHSHPMAGHRGVNATQALVADRFYWKRLQGETVRVSSTAYQLVHWAPYEVDR